MQRHGCYFFFFFNDTATTEIYTLSLHDALPIFTNLGFVLLRQGARDLAAASLVDAVDGAREHGQMRHAARSEEHTSELQSRSDLVCRLLLEKKKEVTCRREVPTESVNAIGIAMC